ncbi:hypothetical protein HBI25_095670 [Parastagonospora nodorum]|nr:hypothetical protein HBH49_146420 [Parastagonospora nodorum]KAH4122937.1 hypothetical protein HBH47_084130 [Parastagonospora nodorum]KAH4170750.1 hypothetical protein HBH43_102690 [Parastagonospora nodorum]KAH4300105.1 hypothetical protein HBI01_113540 [Parastagonospora nodorum]KAH4318859.1 hypothetical protein HBI02_003760 [Parastagonospora nodorum]
MAFLNIGVVLSVFGCSVLLPVITYYVTSALFRQRIQSKASGKIPPTIPYQVPVVFHAFGLASVGPQKYFAQLIQDYGEFGPFFVNAGPQSFLIVRDPKHVDKVCNASRQITPTAFHLELFDKVYGLPAAALNLYAGKTGLEADIKDLQYAHVALTEKHFTGAMLLNNAETYVSILSQNLHDKMFQVGSWTQIEDTWAFFRQVVTRCILVSIFGLDLFKQYPNVMKDYLEFSDTIEGFVPGLPRYWVPGAAIQARDRLLLGIQKWLRANLGGSESARIADEDPTWDAMKGSKFFQERNHVLSNIDVLDMKARATEALSIMHDSLSAMVPCTIWSLLEVARAAEFVDEFTAGLFHYSPSHGATYNIQGLVGMPLMESLLAETMRLRTAAIAALRTQKTLALDEHWAVPADTHIVAISHDMALNTTAWSNVRAQTVERPLTSFWPKRFLVGERSSSKPGTKGRSVGETIFSMEGLESLNMTLGSGQPPILGRDYVRTVHAMTIAVLFNEFEIQLCDDELFDAVLPPVQEAAFGMLRPLDKVAIRIRKRTASK